MKVSEMIAALSHYDPNLDVVNAAWDSLEPNDLAHVGTSLVLGRDCKDDPLANKPGQGSKEESLRKMEELWSASERGPFKEGALVCLKIGGPLMMVEDIRSDGIASCVWFIDGEVHRDSFHPVHLNKFVCIL